MPLGEDELERSLRHMRERRAQHVESLATGAVLPDNVPNGYMQVTGRVQGIDEAIAILKEEFRGWLPETSQSQNKPVETVADRYR